MPDRPAQPRTTVLTDKGLRARGLPTSEKTADLVLVPLINLPARDDRKDLRR